jgi:peptidoglycan/xylan/chitin deacetylase (PgdA/CDA1 family)
MKGIFTISLDFELHWGGFEKWPLEQYRTYFMNTRQAIPEMLRLFERYEVHVTWATVGLLFCESRDQVMAEGPVQKPSYQQPELGAYQYIAQHGIGAGEADDPLHFAPSLVRAIMKTPHQEIATHTFGHYYCQEPGQEVAQFRADMEAAQRVAARYGAVLRSLVFPRNQFNDEYLSACYDLGITSVRSNPLDWFWQIGSTQRESYWKRLNRGLDAYFPVGTKNTYALDQVEVRAGYPLCLPASRLLRPYRPSEGFLNNQKIERIGKEMRRAASRGEVYHLWWHPHNFGHYPKESMAGLERILKQFAQLRDAGKMQSLHMQEIAGLRRK